MSFLEELKRRKILQVAAAYAVVSWLLIQIVATIETPLNLPEWFDTGVIVLFAIGFPIALIISWAFNLTPEGLVRDQGAGRASSRGGRKMEYALAVLLMVAIGWIGYRELFSEPQPGTNRLPNSVAVLPCANFSTDPANEYFAPSLHEELLNQLVKLSNLNVMARTSVLQYDGTTIPIPQIADELNVSSVMECSVAYADDRVVISTQLIDGETGLHLWSDRYNEPFADVFGIQADIAMNVANALNVAFSVDEQKAIERVPTKSAQAYALYLQAVGAIGGGEGAQVVTRLLERVLEYDPNFALAHYRLAVNHAGAIINTNSSNAVGPDEVDSRIELALYHADRARALDPAFAWMFTGATNFFTWRWGQMQEDLEGAPDPIGQQAIWMYSYIGRHDEALRRARRSIELNPLPNSQLTLGIALAYSGDFVQAEQTLKRNILNGGETIPLLRWWHAFTLIALGDEAEALEQLQIAESLMRDNRVAAGLTDIIYAYSRIGRRDDVMRIAAEIEQSDSQLDIGAGGRAYLYLATDRTTEAIEQLRLGVEKIRNHEVDAGFYNLLNIRMNVTADPLLEEPEFVRLREQLRGQ